MAAGDEREALAEVADRLCAELDHRVGDRYVDEPPTSDPADAPPLAGSLGEEDEQLLAAARRSLARIANALRAENTAGVSDITLQALLGGAEIVMRNELAMGNVPSALMPSFVFLVALPLVDQDEALKLSKRAASLLEEAMT